MLVWARVLFIASLPAIAQGLGPKLDKILHEH